MADSAPNDENYTGCNDKMQKHTNSHCMNKDSHTQLAGFDLIKTVQYTEKKRKDKTRQVWRIKEAAIQAPMKSTHFGL